MNQVETAIRCSIVPETPMPSCYTAQSQVFVKYSMWPWLVLQVEWPKENNATSSEANMVERNSYQRPLFPAKRPPPTIWKQNTHYSGTTGTHIPAHSNHPVSQK